MLLLFTTRINEKQLKIFSIVIKKYENILLNFLKTKNDFRVCYFYFISVFLFL